jgi:hypothetical protein
MKAVKIPVTGDIEITDIPDDGRGMFGEGALTERVRFGIPNTNQMYTLGDKVKRTRMKWVVMLVDEEGALKRLEPNPRATALYRGGRHQGVIFGDVYLILEEEDWMQEPKWSDILAPYDQPAFWSAVVT